LPEKSEEKQTTVSIGRSTMSDNVRSLGHLSTARRRVDATTGTSWRPVMTQNRPLRRRPTSLPLTVIDSPLRTFHASLVCPFIRHPSSLQTAPCSDDLLYMAAEKFASPLDGLTSLNR